MFIFIANISCKCFAISPHQNYDYFITLFVFVSFSELEAQEQAKKEKDASQAATPDYAASLMSPAVGQAPPTTTAIPETTETTPSYAPIATITNPATPAPMLSNLATQQQAVNPSQATMAARENLSQQLQNSLQQNITQQFQAPNQTIQNPTPTPTAPTVTTPQVQQQIQQQQPTMQPPPPYPQPTVPGLMSSISGYLNTTAPAGARPNVGVTVSPAGTVMTTGANPAGVTAGGQPKKGLSLTVSTYGSNTWVGFDKLEFRIILINFKLTQNLVFVPMCFKKMPLWNQKICIISFQSCQAYIICKYFPVSLIWNRNSRLTTIVPIFPLTGIGSQWVRNKFNKVFLHKIRPKMH